MWSGLLCAEQLGAMPAATVLCWRSGSLINLRHGKSIDAASSPWLDSCFSFGPPRKGLLAKL